MILPNPFQLLVLAALLAPISLTGQRFSEDRSHVPKWDIDSQFPADLLTFVRIQYTSEGGRRAFWGGRPKWTIDYPDADLNFSYRLQELTSLKVHPDGLVLDLTDLRLHDYPFIYIVEPGNLVFSDPEIKALRNYLFNGGFLMVDDFWGEFEYYNFKEQMTRVFPNPAQALRELPIDHPIFHCVFSLKEKPQIPNPQTARQGAPFGITYEREDAKEVHYQGIFDDDDRMMAIICHNTDLGDGWEEEARDPWYFREFSEKSAYPLGINIMFYVMTH